MTIHQSQGSEFERVAVLLPVKRTSELATRELLYTAVTRTKRTVDVFGSEAVLRRAFLRNAVINSVWLQGSQFGTNEGEKIWRGK